MRLSASQYLGRALVLLIEARNVEHDDASKALLQDLIDESFLVKRDYITKERK